MDSQYEGPLSWRIVRGEHGCRLIVKNNNVRLTITDIRFLDVSPANNAWRIEFDALPTLPPTTELPLRHRTLLPNPQRISDDDFWMEAPSDGDKLIYLCEKYSKGLNDDVLAEFFIDGAKSSQFLKVGAESGLHLMRE